MISKDTTYFFIAKENRIKRYGKGQKKFGFSGWRLPEIISYSRSSV